MKKKGAALIVVVIIMTMVLLLAAFILTTSMKYNRVNSDTINRTKAYYSAESGIYDFVNYFCEENAVNIQLSKGYKKNNEAGGLYEDNMSVYSVELLAPVSISYKKDSVSHDVTEKTCTFHILSSGSYGQQGCKIDANVSVIYIPHKDASGNITYEYYSYEINSKKVYKA